MAALVFMLSMLALQIGFGIYWVFFRFSGERRHYNNMKIRQQRRSTDEIYRVQSSNRRR
jgi:hypothetical protein